MGENTYSRNVYNFPFNIESCFKPKHAPAHTGSMVNAIDFDMPEGTPIFAALDGVVIEAIKEFEIGGPDENNKPFCNLIRILHENDECTEYVHLKHNGVEVKKGQTVKRGDFIGYSGCTGFTTYPHLHFGVYIKNKKKREYLIPRFKFTLL